MSTTYEEILMEQASLRASAQYIAEKAEDFCALLEEPGLKRLIFVGCGSSYMLASGAAATAGMHLDIPAAAVAGGDLMLHLPRYQAMMEGSLVVALSRSGSTSEVVRSLEAARAAGVSFKLAAVSCVDDSPLSKMADLALDMPWAFDRSVCQTRTVSCLYLAALLLIARAAKDEALERSALDAVEGLEDFRLRVEPQIREVAAKAWTNGCVLGDAELAGAADEAALTFKEICQLPSNYYHLLDVRHGPIVVLNQTSAVIVAMSDENDPYERALIEDVKAHGCHVIVCSDEDAHIDGVVNVTFGRKLTQAARGLPLLLTAQLLTVHKAETIGVDPDKPGTLDAWIKL